MYICRHEHTWEKVWWLVLKPVPLAPDVISCGNYMLGDVNLEGPPVLGLGAEQLIELLETFHAQVPLRPDLQGDDSGVVGPGAGHPEVLIPQCLPGCGCSHVGLEGYRELHQVHGSLSLSLSLSLSPHTHTLLVISR